MNRYTDRLLNEWKQHSKIIIAVDYDDTISPWTFKSSEDIVQYYNIINLLKECKQTGAYIVIFTACNEDRYSEIKEYCSKQGLEIDGINEVPINLPYGKNKKIYANIFLDDRAGLDESIGYLMEVLYQYRSYLQTLKPATDVA